MKFIKVISLILAICFMSVLFASCVNKEEEPDVTVETQSDDLVESLGFDRKDYGDYSFSMLVSEGDSFEHISEGLTGSLVSDAVYARNMAIKEFFNIELEIIAKPCNWEDRDDFVGGIKNMILSGDKSYDAVVGIVGVMATGFSSEYFLNIGDMQYIDLSKDYWVKDQFEELNVNEKLFALSGDMNLTLYGNMYGMFFNSKVVEDNGLENLYDLVNNKQWTIEKMKTMAADIGNDIGNEGISLGEDMLGIICQTNSSRGFMTACGIDIFQRAGDGTVSIQTAPSDKYIDVYTKISGLLNENTNYKTPDLNESVEQLAAGKALFSPMYLKSIEDTRIKDVLQNIGIVPYPLYDEAQESYITPLTCNVTVFPINVPKADLSAQVATYMAYYGQAQLAPKYFETHIKVRLASEPEMQVMLDMMRDSATTTLTMMYSSNFSPVLLKLFEVSTSNDFGDAVVSTYKTYAKLYQKEWQKNILPLFN